jgi:hypothetical protein
MRQKKEIKPPTREEKIKPVYENQDLKIFPHALTEYQFSCPQSAVFRIESNNGVKAYMSISHNIYICALSSKWQEVFDDFLLFARANKLTGDKIALADFFKHAPGEYCRFPMQANLDLLDFVEEVQPLDALDKTFRTVYKRLKKN